MNNNKNNKVVLTKEEIQMMIDEQVDAKIKQVQKKYRKLTVYVGGTLSALSLAGWIVAMQYPKQKECECGNVYETTTNLLNGVKNELQQQIDEENSRTSSLENTVNTAIEDLENQKTSLETQFKTSLEEQLKDYETRMKELEEQVEEMNEQMSSKKTSTTKPKTTPKPNTVTNPPETQQQPEVSNSGDSNNSGDSGDSGDSNNSGDSGSSDQPSEPVNPPEPPPEEPKVDDVDDVTTDENDKPDVTEQDELDDSNYDWLTTTEARRENTIEKLKTYRAMLYARMYQTIANSTVKNYANSYHVSQKINTYHM